MSPRTILLCLVALIGVAPWAMTLAQGPDAPLHYNQVQQKHTHNSYQRKQSVFDQALYYMVRSFEIDVHIQKPGHQAVPGDWYVWHKTKDVQTTTCHLLSDCLGQLAALRDVVPNHEVITVWIEFKHSRLPGDHAFDDAHTPVDLDRLLTRHVGAARIVTPASLVSRCPLASTLQESVMGTCTWPALAELRGKFLFVLLGYTQPYARADYPQDRVAFIQGRDRAIFYNKPAFFAENVYEAGFVNRLTKANNGEDWIEALESKVHFIGTDKVSYHTAPWSRTHNHRGWPFRCLRADCSRMREVSNAIGVVVASGEIWGTADDFYFLHQQMAPGAPEPMVWTGLIAVAESPVAPQALGCLMARANLSRGSPYYAVCRPAAEHGTRIQYRLQQDGATERVELPGDARTTHHKALVGLRLSDGLQCAGGQAALPGQVMPSYLLAPQCFGAPLALQGLAASSHGADEVKFVFGNVTVQLGEDRRGPQTHANFQQTPIGRVDQAQSFAGLFPDDAPYQAYWRRPSPGGEYAGKSSRLVTLNSDATATARAEHR